MPTVTTYPGVFGPYSPITFIRNSTGTYFDSNGVLQTAGNNVPRLDYDPSTLAPLGFLVEEARTNSIRNNTMQGAVAGTPGTPPTNWGYYNPLLLSTQIVGTGVSNGITYVDLRVFGIAASSSLLSVNFDSSVFISASIGQTWTSSVWTAVVGGTTNNISSVQIRSSERDATNEVGSTSANVSLTGTLVRSSVTRTFTSAATIYALPYLAVNINPGAIDITLRIGLPQLENNNTSTGVASATVAAGGSGYAVGDVLQIVGGTGSTAARLTVATLSGSAVATVTVSTAGLYSVFPSPQPVSVTAITGTGTSATFNIVPQAQSGFATSVIPTTTTALTRNPDQASVNTLSPWYNSAAGTLFAESSVNYTVPATFFPLAASLNDNSSNNRIEIGYLTSVLAAFEVSTGGTPQATLYPPNAAQIRKTAGAYAANDFAVSTNGSAASVDPSGSVPTVTRLALGARTTGGTVIHLRRVTYYPRRLTNAELQAITA